MDINTELRKKARKKGFIKYFFKLMNNAAFGGTIRNMKKHRNIKLVTTQARRNYLISEPNYHTTNFFIRNINSNGNEKNTNIDE